MLYFLIFLILLAVLGPLFGRDSRDGPRRASRARAHGRSA
ncbi:hypothetical protein GCM10010439_47550 [Actinocorallia aurantiaca]|uniref:Uncharacterized protein n=1 Tax=Actinocorallia aurantiaca TaxID=46204 RepID=A0ABP6GX20_9ACTN